MRNTRVFAALALCAVAALSGCDSSSDSTEPTTSASASSAAEAAPSTADSAPTGTATQTAKPSPDASLSLQGVNFGTHDGYDSVTFVLTGPGVPGYHAQYVDQAVQDGSGNPIPITGASFLQVRIADVPAPFEPGAVPYKGANPIQAAGAGVVTEVYVANPYEGGLDAFLGIRTERPPFRVSVLSNPTRVVVDVATCPNPSDAGTEDSENSRGPC